MRPGARTRGSLSREEILAAGLRVAREDDLRNLTMKRLGDELGVTGMAIYRHFQNKREVIDGILDHFVHAADVTGHATDPSDWRAWMRATFAAMYRALAETPGVLPFVATSEGWRFGPAALAVIDETLGVLRGAGFDRRVAVEIQTTALALAVGWATLDADRGPGPAGGEAAVAELARRFAGEASAAHPHVMHAARELASASCSAGLFERGLERVLEAAALAVSERSADTSRPAGAGSPG